MALLDRLERLAPADIDVEVLPAPPPRIRRYTHRMARRADPARPERRGVRAATMLLLLAIGLATGVLVMVARSSGAWPWSLSLSPSQQANAPAVSSVTEPLPVPSASEATLARARAWSASGRLRDALAALEAIRPGDPLRAQADDLRARIQQQLLDSAHANQPAPSAGSPR